jgi:hypothetical protein
MSGSLSFVILSPVFGRIADIYSLSAAFIALAFFLVISGFFAIFMLIKNRVA